MRGGLARWGKERVEWWAAGCGCVESVAATRGVDVWAEVRLLILKNDTSPRRYVGVEREGPVVRPAR